MQDDRAEIIVTVTPGATSVEQEATTDYPGLDPIAMIDAGVRQADAAVRKDVATNIVALFKMSNLFTLGALAVVFIVDSFYVGFHVIAPQERVITSKVVMALLGATTIQVGALMMIIGRNLFPSPDKPTLWQRISSK